MSIHLETTDLSALAHALRHHPHVVEKLNIAAAYAPSLPVSGRVQLGDDTAALPEETGYLLFAAEGMMEKFVAADPWFAGYCAVMVNLSDIAAMGGRALAIVDLLWADAESPAGHEIWAGLQAASANYGVPIVGGHTCRLPIDRTPFLAAAVLGRAEHLISSFTSRPGDGLLMAIDLRGAYRGEGTLFWNASTEAPPARMRGDLALLPALARTGLLSGGKDISNGGILGTLAMLLSTSRCGATVHLDAIPRPREIELERWLLSFPSYGFLLTADPENIVEISAHFAARDLVCVRIGEIESGSALNLTWANEQIEFTQIQPAPEPRPTALSASEV